jgi:hypothetical protein
MSLFFHLLIHLSLALIVGIVVWLIWRRPIESFVAALCGGFFVDLDHLIDYFIVFGMSLRLDYFFSGYQFLKSDKIIILFHGWEYAIILGVSMLFLKSKKAKSIALGLFLGLFIHLASDSFLNELPARSYSVLYRIKKEFSIEDLVTPEHYQIHIDKKKSVKFE